MAKTADQWEEGRTKAELRDKAHSWGISIPRGATKRDVAELLEREEQADVVRRREGLTELDRGDLVGYDGSVFRVGGTDRARAEATAYEEDGRRKLVFNKATAGGGIAVFDDRGDERLDVVESLRVYRVGFLR
jgi:hypothetical protein